MRKIFILAFLLCSPCFADDTSVVRIAKKGFNESLVELDTAEERCKKEEVVLDSGLFDGLKASNRDLKAAILYLYYKAKIRCSERELKEYLLASVILGSIENKEIETIISSNNLMVKPNVQMIRLSGSYNSLPDSLRSNLDNIVELKHPFNLIKTLENIGVK